MTLNVREAMSWCFKNDIKIIIKPLSKTGKPDAIIEIHREGKIQIGNETYRQDKILHKKIEELYLYLHKTLR